jgi:hypothetical protein
MCIAQLVIDQEAAAFDLIDAVRLQAYRQTGD